MDWVGLASFVTAAAGAVTTAGNVYLWKRNDEQTKAILGTMSEQGKVFSSASEANAQSVDRIVARFEHSQRQMDRFIDALIQSSSPLHWIVR